MLQDLINLLAQVEHDFVNLPNEVGDALQAQYTAATTKAEAAIADLQAGEDAEGIAAGAEALGDLGELAAAIAAAAA